jgi:polysaccharide biosynthesis protein PslG
MKARWALLALVTSAWAARAADLPEPVLPQGVGVNIHFVGGHARDLDLIAAAGFKVVRMDFSWGGTERKEGEYDWSAYDGLTGDLEKRGLRAVYILDYSNALYEEAAVSENPVTHQRQRGTASPQHPQSVAAFARWAAAAAKHYRGRRVIWEVWNEPNIGFWKPRPDVNQYAALCLATCKAVRAADPDATVVAPASSEVPPAFLEPLFAAGVLADLDAVSVHPYRPNDRPPETAAEDYRQLRRLIERHAPEAKKDLPILSGEWGYASDRKGVAPETQAAYLARMQLANLLAGVNLSIWYDWKDDGPDPAEREHNFGTVRQDLEPKPAYLAARTLTRELAGYRIARRLDAGGEKDYVLLLRNEAGRRKLAAWTLGEPHAVTLDGDLVPAGKLTGTTVTGDSFTPKLADKKLVLDLTAGPRYVGPGENPR